MEKTYPAQKGLPPIRALKGVSLDIRRGSIFGLLGPNGAGKSTLINIFAGLVKKTGGRGEIWGVDIDQNPRQARAAIGVVPQEINMDPFFTPIESLEYQAGFYGVPKKERRSMEILEAMGLADKANAYVRSLSGGMKRRLLMAKALVHSPPVLVLDEPTAGVDIELRKQLWNYVRELNARGATIILTTHYLEEAQELCDTIAIINHGEVVACEAKEKLLKRMDHKTLTIQPKERLEQIPQSLSDLQAELDEAGALHIRYRAGTQSVGQLIEQVRASGISISDLQTQEPDLEDVFLSLTSGSPS
ncbi:MAG: multidrug ABC transporter ATP-binding protein [Robiginitomaculum sp.]|nr:MAG: multidrug ABC transporter ATP-binding protein [Robiginitomaculum sp.]